MLRSQCVCQFSSALYDVYMSKLPKRKKERQRWTDGQATPQREVTLALQNSVCFGGMSSTGMLTHLLHSCCRVSRDLCLSVQETITYRLNKWGKQVNTGQPVAKCHVQVYLEVFLFLYLRFLLLIGPFLSVQTHCPSSHCRWTEGPVAIFPTPVLLH